MTHNPARLSRVRKYFRRLMVASPTLGERLAGLRLTVVSPSFLEQGMDDDSFELGEIRFGRGYQPDQVCIVDDSNEGRSAKRYEPWVPQLAEHYSIPPERVIVLTQNEEFLFEASGTTTRNFVNASSFNWQFDRAVHFASVYADRASPVSISADDYRLRFLSLNNVPRPHRITLLALMMDRGLHQVSAISFHMTERPNGKSPKDFTELAIQRFPEWATPIRQFMTQSSLPMVLESEEARRNFWGFPSVADQCLWFLVTETDYSANYEQFRVRRVTEKTMKALVFGKPFILIGNPLTLDYLQELGFVTYSSVIDESYDLVLDPRERMQKIISTLEDVAKQAITRGMLGELRRIAQANKDWLLGGFRQNVTLRQADSLALALERAGF